MHHVILKEHTQDEVKIVSWERWTCKHVSKFVSNIIFSSQGNFLCAMLKVSAKWKGITM